MKIQRKWRRAWKRGEPLYLARFRKPTLKRQRTKLRLLRSDKAYKAVAAGLSALTILDPLGLNIAAAASNNIVTDGRTQTTVATNGNITNITTGTVSGVNGFNSFQYFNVGSGNTVNLELAKNTANLLNFVTGGQQSTIYGILNSIKDGKIGGNVYFLNPQGMMVGAGGVVNVGSLTVFTPTKAFMDSVYNSALQQYDPAAVQGILSHSLQNAYVPIDSSGSIVVKGKINAINDIKMYAGNVTVDTDTDTAGNVVSRGEIKNGAVFTATAPGFSDVVNTNGLNSGAKIQNDNGSIEIVANEQIINNGTVANLTGTSAGTGVKTNNVTIQGKDAQLNEGSVVSARGYGSDSSGGTVTVKGTQNASFNKGAVIDVRGGEKSGDGGQAELSAGDTVTMGGGTFKTGAVTGKAGTAVVDPKKLQITADVLPGSASEDGIQWSSGNLTLTADDEIDIGSNDSAAPVAVTVSSRNIGTSSDYLNAVSQGNSGSISITAPTISISDNSAVLAHVIQDTGNTYNAGSITMTGENINIGKNAKILANVAQYDSNVTDQWKNPAASAGSAGDITMNAVAKSYAPAYGQSSAGASITIGDGAALSGNKINVSAVADNSSIFDGDNDSNAAVSSLKDKISSAAASGVAKLTELLGSLEIEAGVTITDATAKISVGSASITSVGSTSITSQANSTADLRSLGVLGAVAVALSDATATVDLNSGAKVNAGGNVTVNATTANTVSATGNILYNLPIDVVVAIGDASSTARANVAEGASIYSGGNVSVAAQNTKNMSVTTSVKGNTDFMGAAIAVSLSDTNVNANIAGEVQAQGDVKVDAEALTTKNATQASSQIGDDGGFYDPVTGKLVDALKVKELEKKLKDATDPYITAIENGAKNVASKAGDELGAGWTWLKTKAGYPPEFGPKTEEDSKGTMDKLKEKLNALEDKLAPVKKFTDENGLTAAVVVTDHDTNATASITSSGTTKLNDTTSVDNAVKAFGAVDVTSKAEEKIQTGAASKITTPKQDPDKSAQDQPQQKKNGASVAVVVGGFTNTSEAYIGDNAVVDAGKFLNISATTSLPYDMSWDDFSSAKDITKIKNFLNTDLGAKQMVNSWAQSSSDTTDNGLAGSVDVLSVTNNTHAYIGKGAKVNQDTAYRNGADAQDVTVQALTQEETVDLSGDFKSIMKNIDTVQNPFGNDPGQAGIGASFLGLFYDNDTSAKVESGASVYAQDMTVTANTASKNIALAVAGGQAGSYGIDGTVTVTGINDATIAKIDDGATIITARKTNVPVYDKDGNITSYITKDGTLNVGAKDDTVTINASGGVTEGGSVGVGASVSVNQIGRDTEALIGNLSGESDDTGSTIAAGGAAISAQNTGNIVSLSLAAAATSDSSASGSTSTAGTATNDDDPLDGVSLPALFGETDQGTEKKPAFGVGVSGDVSYNAIRDFTAAYISDSSVEAKNANLTSTNDSSILSVAGAATLTTNDKGSAGIAGSATVNYIVDNTVSLVDNSSLITDNGDAKLDAETKGTVVTLDAGGSVAPKSKGVALAGAVTVNRLANATRAYAADNSTITAHNGSVAIQAGDTTSLISAAGGLAYGGKAGIGASVAVNLTDNDAEAFIANSDVNADYNITASALMDENIATASASLGATLDGYMAANAAVSVNVLTDTTKAYISGKNGTAGNGTNAGGSIALSALNDSDLVGIAGGAALALSNDSAGVGASSATLVATNDTEAYIDANTPVSAKGQQSVGYYTVDRITNNDVSTNLMPMTSDGAVSFDTSSLKPQTATGIAVVANNSDDVILAAAGGAAGGEAGVAAAAPVSVITDTTKTYIGPGAQINSDNSGAAITQSVSLLAADNTVLKNITGGIGISTQGVGVGAGADVDVITKTTEAYIDSTAADTDTGKKATTVNANDNITVQAYNTENIIGVGLAFGGGNAVGVAGAVSTHVLTDTTKAYIGDSATVTSGGSVQVAARDDDNTLLLSGNAAYGGDVGVGIGAGVSVITKDTEAYIADNATIQADANRDAIDADTGEFTIAYTLNPLSSNKSTASAKNPSVNSDDSNISNATTEELALLSEYRTATRNTAKVKGVAVTADSTDNIKTTAAGGAASETVAVQGSAGANVVTNTTKAYVGENAKVNQSNGNASNDQSVLVAAGSDVYHLGVAEAVAVSGSVGVGPGADVNVITSTTKAYVDSGANIAAKRDIAVNAAGAESVLSEAAALSGSGDVAVAGSVTVNYLKTDTEAYIADKPDGGTRAVVQAGNNVLLNAEDNTTLDVISGSAGLGFSVTGVGGSVSANILDKTTKAYVGANAVVDADAKAVDANGKAVADPISVLGIDAANNKATGSIQGLAVQADSSENLFDITASGGGGFYAGVAGAAAVNVVTTDTEAYIGKSAAINADKTFQSNAQTAQAVNVTAADDLNLFSVGGALSGGAVGVSGGADIGVINTNTDAYIGDNTLLNSKGNIDVNAYSNKEITSNAASVSAGAVGVAGGVSVYVVGTSATEEALSKLNSKADANNDTTAQGYVDSQISSTGTPSLLSSYKDPNMKNAGTDVSAAISGGTRSDGTTDAGIGKVSDALSTSAKVPAGTNAYIGKNVSINKKYSDGTALSSPIGESIDLVAVDKITHKANTASAVIAGGGDGVGGAVSVGVIKNVANAYIDQGTAGTTAGNLSVHSAISQDIRDINLGAGAGGDNGIAANFSVNVITGDASAYMNTGSNTFTAHDIIVQAKNDTTVNNKVGAAAYGANNGVGAAMDVAVITKDTEAYISGNITAAGNMTIQSASSEDLQSITAGAAGGGESGIAGDGAGYSLADTTKAYIAGGSTILADGSLWLDADSATKMSLSQGTLAATDGVAGIGAGAGVAVVNKTTQAYIGTEDPTTGALDASHTSVTALGGGSDLSVDDGSFTASYGDYASSEKNPISLSDTAKDKDGKDIKDTNNNSEKSSIGTAKDTSGDQALSQKRTVAKGNTSLHGLAVTATNQDDIRTFAVGAALSGGGLGAALSGGVSVVSNTTNAKIGDQAKINQDNDTGSDKLQSVRVAAGNDLSYVGVAGALAGGGVAGIGAGANVAVITDRTNSTIGQSAQVNANNSLTVNAQDEQQLISLAANASASDEVAVAGSASVFYLDNATHAAIGDSATIYTGGNALINASDTTGTDLIAGDAAVGFGIAGVGGAVGVTYIKKDTQATVGSSATMDVLAAPPKDSSNNSLVSPMEAVDKDDSTKSDAVYGLLVQAQSQENVLTVDAAGAGGFYAGVAGAVSVESLDLTTHAGIGSGAKINTVGGSPGGGSVGGDQSVTVAAHDNTKLTTITGALAGGLGAGIAGGVDVGVIKDDTLADIGTGAAVNAKQDVAVYALSEKTVNSTTVSASGGFLGAIAGGVSVYSIGNGLDSDAASRLSTATTYETNDTSREKKDPTASSVDQYADQQAVDSSVTSLLGKSNSSSMSGINSTAASSRSGVSTSSTLAYDPTVTKGTIAHIGAGANIHAGSKVTVQANDKINLNINAGAASVGSVGLGAGVGVVTVSDAVKAYADGTSSSTGNTQITTGSGAVNIDAVMNETASDKAYVGSGGIVAVDAAAAILKDSSDVESYIGDYTEVKDANAAISKDNFLTVATTDSRSLTANTVGVGAGFVSAGASIAETSIGGSDSAYLGDHVDVSNLSAITVQANAAALNADSEAVAAAGGIGLAASGTVADAAVTTSVTARTGSSDILTPIQTDTTTTPDIDGTISVKATATPKATAIATGINAAGGAAVGVSMATAKVAPTIMAELGNGSTITAAGLSVTANQYKPAQGFSADAEAFGAAGALLFGGNASLANAESDSTVESSIDADSRLTVTGTTTLSAVNNSTQNAQADGLQVGIVALGATIAKAGDKTTTTAMMGTNINLNSGTNASSQIEKSQELAISATANIDNEASSTLGTGGVLAGSGAEADTFSSSTTKASAGFIPDSSSGSTGSSTPPAGYTGLAVKTLTIDSNRKTTFNSFVDSTNASIAGLSGSKINNDINSQVTSGTGNQTDITTYDLTMNANNESDKTWQWDSGTADKDKTADNAIANIKASTLGLANASAGVSSTTVAHSTQALIGDGAHITVDDPDAANHKTLGIFQVNALNTLNLQDKGVLHSGGAITLPKVEEYITVASPDTDGNMVNPINASVNFGKNAAVTVSSGDLLVGARTSADVEAIADVDAWGLAGQPQGVAHALYNGANNVTVGDAATLIADRGNVVLAAGEDTALAQGNTSAGLANTILAATTVDTWNKTAIPQVIAPDADTTVHNNNTVTINQNAGVYSAGDIGLYGDGGTVTLKADGDAKDVYRAAANAIINAFGGNVSTDLLGGETHKDGAANITVDGTVATGRNSEKDVTVDVDLVKTPDTANGDTVKTDAQGNIILVYDKNGNVRWSPKVTTSGEGLTYSHTQGTIASEYEARIKELRSLQDQYAGDQVAYTAYQSEIEYLQSKLDSMGVTKDGVGTGSQPKISPHQSAVNDKASMEASQKAASDKMTQDTDNKTTAQQLQGAEANLQALDDAVKHYYSAVNQYYTDSSASSPDNTLISNDAANVTTMKAALDTAISNFSSTGGTVTLSNGAKVTTNLSDLQTAITTLDTAITTYQNSKTAANLSLINSNNKINSYELASSDRNAVNADQTVTLVAAIKSLDDDYTVQKKYYDTYGSQINALATQLAITDPTNSQYLSDVVPSDPTADFINVGNISITTGSIKVKGDNLLGSGALNAPNNAVIKITNNTPAFLTINDLNINDQGGRILLNGFEVNSLADIQKINADTSSAMQQKVKFSSLVTKESSSTSPQITITSTYDPNNTVFKDAGGNIITYDGTTPIVLGQAPDIQLTGTITNLKGDLTVTSEAGNISVNSGVQAGTVNITAKNGDFVLSYVNKDSTNSALDFYNVGGDPAALDVSGSTKKAGGITANGSVILSGRYLNINGTIQSGTADWKLSLPTDPVLTGTAAQLGVNQTDIDAIRTNYNNALAAAGSDQSKIDAVKAQYKTNSLTNDASENVNYNAVNDRLEVNMSWAQHDAKTTQAVSRNSSKTYSVVDDYGNVDAAYNADKDDFSINNVSVQGGYIKLYGQILNTSTSGAGNLNVLDGYAQFNITNNTGKDIEINSLDTGRGTAGKIDIQDIQYVETTYKTDADGNSVVSGTTPHIIETTYTRDKGTITKQQQGGWVDADGNLTTAIASGARFSDNYSSGIQSVASGRETSYNPQAGLEYVWTEGTDKSTKIYYKYTGVQFFGDSDLTAITDKSSIVSGPFTVGSERLADGTYLLSGSQAKDRWIADGGSGDWDGAKTYDYQYTISNGAPVTVKTNEYTKTKWYTWLSFGAAKEYVIEFNITTPTKTITQHYMKADNAININFIGSDSGNVTINSSAGGSVLLNGSIRNQGGTTTIQANQSILQNTTTALITTKNLNLTAATGSIGYDVSSPIRAVITDNGILSATAAQNVRLDEVLGDVQLGKITAGDTVNISAEGSITRYQDSTSVIQGKRIELTSSDGGIGSKDNSLLIQTGYTSSTDPNDLRNYGLEASARGDISITNQAGNGNSNGDLLVDTVVSSGGDVWLKTDGRLLDNNPVEHIDERQWSELQSYWKSMALTEGTANDEKQSNALATYVDQQDNSYKTYWKNVNSGNFDSNGNYQVSDAERNTLTARYKNSGITDQQVINQNIADYAASRTAEQKQLITQGVNNWTAADDAKFDYTTNTNTQAAYQSYKDQLLSGATWTTTELGVSLTPGTLKQLTDTNPVVKDPNVSGKSVTLTAGRIGTSGNVLLPTTTSNGKTTIDITQLTPEQRADLVMAERSDWTDLLTNYTIQTFKPVNVQVMKGGLLQATANAATDGIVYLASEQDINLGQIAAGSGEEVRIKGGGSIFNALTDSSANISGGDVVLEAATGTIGTSASPIKLGNTGHTLTARADGSIYIVDDQNINVDTIFSRQDVTLTSAGNILNAYPGNSVTGDTGNDLNISSNSLTMTAGSIGQTGQPLKVSLGSTGALDAVASTGEIYLVSPKNSITVNRASAAGDVILTGAQDILINPSSTADGIISSTGSVVLTSIGGSILHNGTAVIRDIQAAKDIELTAGKTVGTVVNAVPTFLDVESSGQLTVSAGEGIYLKESDSLMNVASATSTDGPVVLNAAGSLTATTVTATNGSVTMTGHSGITVGTTTGIGVGMTADTGDIKATQTVATGSDAADGVTMTAKAGSIQADTVTAQGGKVILAANGGSITSTGISGSSDRISGKAGVEMTAVGSITADDVGSSDGAISLTATTGNIETGTVTATTGNVTMKGHAGITAGTTIGATGVSLTADTGDIKATQTTATGSDGADGVTMTADTGNIDTTNVESSAGDITVDAKQGTLGFTHVIARKGSVSLTAQQGDLKTAAADPAGNIQANSITLTANNGSIGESANPLLIDSSTTADGVVTATAQGNVYLKEVDGNFNINQVQSSTKQGNIGLTVANGSLLNRSLQTGDVNLVGQNITLTAALGSIGETGKRLVAEAGGILNASADSDVDLEQHAGNLQSEYIRSAHGSMDLNIPDGKAVVTDLSVPNGTLKIAAAGGMKIENLDVSQINLDSPLPDSIIEISQVRVSHGMTINADTINLPSVTGTGSGPLEFSFGGGSQALAKDITVKVTSPTSIDFTHVAANTATIQAQADTLQFDDTIIGSRADINNNFFTVVVNNYYAGTLEGDVELNPGETPFNLYMSTDKHVSTSSRILNYDPSFLVNDFSTENSYTRASEKMPVVVTRSPEIGGNPMQFASPTPVEISNGGVNVTITSGTQPGLPDTSNPGDGTSNEDRQGQGEPDTSGTY